MARGWRGAELVRARAAHGVDDVDEACAEEKEKALPRHVAPLAWAHDAADEERPELRRGAAAAARQAELCTVAKQVVRKGGGAAPLRERGGERAAAQAEAHAVDEVGVEERVGGVESGDANERHAELEQRAVRALSDDEEHPCGDGEQAQREERVRVAFHFVVRAGGAQERVGEGEQRERDDDAARERDAHGHGEAR